MKKIKTISKKIAKHLPLIAVILVVVTIMTDLYWETIGLPKIISRQIFKNLPADATVHFRSCRGGVVHGIVFEDLKITTSEYFLQAEKIVVRPKYLSFLSKTNQIHSLELLGGTVVQNKKNRCISEICGRASYIDDALIIYDSKAKIGKTNISLNCQYLNLTKLIQKLKQKDGEKRDYLDEIEQFIEREQIDYSQANLVITIVGDGLDADKTSFISKLNIKNPEIREVGLQELSAEIYFNPFYLEISQIHAIINRREFIKANIHIDLKNKLISGDTNLSIRPETITTLNVATETIPRYIYVTHPIQMQLKLLPSSFPFQEWHLTAKADTGSGILQNLPFQKIEASAVMENNILQLQNLTIQLSSKEQIITKATIDLKRQTVSATAEAQLFIFKRLAKIESIFGKYLNSFHCDKETANIKVILDKSPFNYKKLRGNIKLLAQNIRIKDQPLEKLLLKSSFHDLTLNIDELFFQKNATIAHSISGSFAWHEQKKYGSIKLLGPNFTLNGTTNYNKKNNNLKSKLHLTLYPDKLYSDIIQLLNIPKNLYISLFKTENVETVIDCELNKSFQENHYWSITGKIEAANIGYDCFCLHYINSDFSLDSNCIDFTKINGKTIGDGELNLNLKVDFKEKYLLITDANTTIDPRIASAFIPTKQGKNIYGKIWKHFVWQTENKPEIKLNSLLVRFIPSGIQPYLEIDALVKMDRFKYRNKKAKQLKCAVKLALPEIIKIEDIQVVFVKEITKGSIHILPKLITQCSLELENVGGDYDPLTILNLIEPKWREEFSQFKLPPQAIINCKGNFSVGGNNYLQLKGDLVSNKFQFDKFEFTGIKANWGVNNNIIFWNIDKSKLYDGNANISGLYNLDTKNGKLSIQLNKVNLKELVLTMADKKNQINQPYVKGELTGYAQIEFFKNWANIPLQIDGTGHITLTNADVWSIPVLRQLGDKISGRISTIDADLDFGGKKLHVPHLWTDGSYVALAGFGDYYWHNNKLNFIIKGQLLKNIKYIGWIFQPILSPLINAELIGTIRKPEWHFKLFKSKK